MLNLFNYLVGWKLSIIDFFSYGITYPVPVKMLLNHLLLLIHSSIK